MNADLGSDSDSDDGDFDPTKEKHEGNQITNLNFKTDFFSFRHF